MEQSYTIQPIEAYRAAFAPVLRAQQEGLKAFGRLARLQYAIARDVLEHNLAGVRAAVSAATPVEYLAAQGQLNAHFLRKVATHTREFLTGTDERNLVASSLPAPAIVSSEVQLLLREGSEYVQHELAEEEQDAAQLDLGDSTEENVDDEPATSASDTQSVDSAARKSTKARQSKKRSERSRRA